MPHIFFVPGYGTPATSTLPTDPYARLVRDTFGCENTTYVAVPNMHSGDIGNTSIQAVVRHVMRVLADAPEKLEDGYILCGHSMGGLVALLVAQALPSSDIPTMPTRLLLLNPLLLDRQPWYVRAAAPLLAQIPCPLPLPIAGAGDLYEDFPPLATPMRPRLAYTALVALGRIPVHGPGIDLSQGLDDVSVDCVSSRGDRLCDPAGAKRLPDHATVHELDTTFHEPFALSTFQDLIAHILTVRD